MPYTDEDGNIVEKGVKAVATRDVTFTSGGANTQTVTITELHSVTNVLGATTNDEGQADEANDEAVDAAPGTGDNEVDLTFYVPDGAGSLVAGTPSADRTVTVIAEGY